MPPPPPQPSRGQGYTSRGHQGGGPQGYQQTAAVQALHAQMLQQQQLQQLQQQQMMQSAQMAQMQRATAVANQATASAPFRVPQMGLTQAQEDELRLQYLTGQPAQPLRQVSVPMPELERYNSGRANGWVKMLGHENSGKMVNYG